MRIHTFGNTLNNAYNIAKWLRQKGVDARVFVNNNDGLEQDLPWWEDRELDPSNLPDWIRYYPRLRHYRRGHVERAFLSEFADCDLAHVWGDGPVWAVRAGIPFVFSSFGWDLELPFSGIRWKRGLKALAQRRGIHFGLRSWYIGKLQKAALPHARAICIVPDMYFQLGERLRPLELESLARFVPLPWDTTKYQFRPSPLQARYDAYDKVFFSPTRHYYGERVIDVKGNDKLIRAFARLVREGRTGVRLLLVRKGPCVKQSETLVNQLGMSEYVEWLPDMPKAELEQYYCLRNSVVCDQFLRDDWWHLFPSSPEPFWGLGAIGAEALSYSRPLVTYFHLPADSYHEFPPVFSALTEKQILERLREVASLSWEELMRRAELGRAWVVKYHGWETVMDRYLKTYNEALRS